ncbi:MAG TPA: phosphate/phosphite/phosphonate ABC transporter substrate-binding protein, partial [Gemmataceae bacterium]|nr:phosphate/phosphite/phosphonate ABC transporter substrate-binding protein [Gemmataceae bacterium]
GALSPAKTISVDLQSASSQPSGEAGPVPLRIGVAAMISPKITYTYYEKLLKRAGEILGRRVEIVQRKSYQEMNDLLNRREIDMAFVCAGPYVTGHDQFGMELLVAPVSHGKQVYHSYIIVREDSGIRSVDDLRGRTFAYTDPDSNSGCLAPRHLLAGRGQTPGTFFGRCFYSYSHDNSIQAVIKGTADGAAVDSIIWEFAKDLDPSLASQIKIVWQSPAYGIPPIVVHPNVAETEKERLRHLLLHLHEDESARRFMQELRIDRFDRTTDTNYESVRQMLREIPIK